MAQQWPCVVSTLKPGLWFKIMHFDAATGRGTLCGAMGDSFDADLKKETLLAKNYKVQKLEFDEHGRLVTVLEGASEPTTPPTPAQPLAQPLAQPPTAIAQPPTAIAQPLAQPVAAEEGVTAFDASDWGE